MSVSAYVTNFNNNTITRIDVNTHKVLATIPVGVFPNGIAVSPNGKRVYVANPGVPGSKNGTVSVISTLTNKVIRTIPMGDNEPFWVAAASLVASVPVLRGRRLV